MARPTTGLRPLDDFLGSVLVGDNIVYEASDGVSIDSLVSAFVSASARANGLAYVSFHVPPNVILDRFADRWDVERFQLVDCFTDGLGGSDPAFARFYRTRTARTHRVTRVRDVGDLEAVRSVMNSVEDDMGANARYVFDSLTGMQQSWGAEGALSFFLRTCPRLYELRTVAVWLLDGNAVDASFHSRLMHVTQVVLRIESIDDALQLRVMKAEGRPPEVTGRRATVRFQSGRAILDQERATGTKEEIGARLRQGRRDRGLSQAELARRIGISPSALSQAERGTAGLSGSTLTRAWHELGMPFGDDERSTGSAYRVARRGARRTRSIASGILAEVITEPPSGTAVYLLRVGPGASGRRPPFPTKRTEVAFVVSGVIELRIGEVSEALQAGDAIEITTQTVAGWRNMAPQETVIVWSVMS
jgi:transcriptional regulator with XRE-family HTH domain